MSVEFKSSETKANLMRAFAGESQARNRYTFAAEKAMKQKLHVIECIFRFTADQEKEHATIFMTHLKELDGETVAVDGTYPVETTESVLQLLKNAQHNEMEEFDPVYKTFAEIAEKEGFPAVAASFRNIAQIEKSHSERFKKFADWMEQNQLFVSDMECDWLCLNCGHVHTGKSAPQMCPVCQHEQGYFVRITLAPYTSAC